jgi:hypothetical protein
MQDFEKLGLFYLGREYDVATHTPRDVPVLYDSRDLLTHAVCVGMTGSGKTGLCLSLIEEAAIDGVPVIAIDPKGDLGNLLLTFPTLSAAEFRPWIDEQSALRAGKTLDDYAEEEARRWREGLSAFGQDEARIERLRNAAELTIYTPGSRAGVPLSILNSFGAPRGAARDDLEALGERAAGTATSVLGLCGVDAVPGSREHTLMATLLGMAWQAGRDLDLAGLIHAIQSPALDKIGVLDLESFFPARERFELAMRLNNLLAAPGFSSWLDGEPLDPATLLYTASGRPRVAIISIAHLGDAERMFFVSLILNHLVGWIRTQTGTSSLRAVLFMDEIQGYFPPVANPPSKGPLLTLLKQARAFGLGVVLATQNPVDLDYKGLSNTGTWFLGRLQTERDKARLLDGLQGASGALDRTETDRLLSSLEKRVFLLHDVHNEAPTTFQTRWTLSYLRGPLTRDQIRALSSRNVHGALETPASPTPRPVRPSSTAPVVVPPGIDQFFLPVRTSAGGLVRYEPVALAAATVTFSDSKAGIAENRAVLYAASIDDGAVPVDWTRAEALADPVASLSRTPVPNAAMDDVPAAALQPRNYAEWGKAFGRWLAQTQTLDLWQHRRIGLTSRAGETERDFRIRVQDALRAARDEAVDEVRRKYAARQAQLAERQRRAEAAVGREREQASHQKLQTAVSMGATLLGALFGRKPLSSATLGRATTTARGVGRSMKEAEDVARAGETLESVRQQVDALDGEIRAVTARIASQYETDVPLDRVSLAPKRGQVSVQFVALGWVPRSDAASTA